MIELMEGVEDIPGTALYEGIEWGRWETFPEYIDYLGTRQYTLDVGTQIPHSALRNYVMGERALNHEDATSADLVHMQQIVEEALRAGALGFSTSRTIGHRSIVGEPIPGTFAEKSELLAIGLAMKNAGRGVFSSGSSWCCGRYCRARTLDNRTRSGAVCGDCRIFRTQLYIYSGAKFQPA